MYGLPPCPVPCSHWIYFQTSLSGDLWIHQNLHNEIYLLWKLWPILLNLTFVPLRQVVRISDKTVRTLIISTNAQSSLYAFLAVSGRHCKVSTWACADYFWRIPEKPKTMVSLKMGAGRRKGWGGGRCTVHYVLSVRSECFHYMHVLPI